MRWYTNGIGTCVVLQWQLRRPYVKGELRNCIARPLPGAILYFRLNRASRKVGVSTIGKPILKNMGVATWITSLRYSEPNTQIILLARPTAGVDLVFPVERSIRECWRCHHWKVHPQKHWDSSWIDVLRDSEPEMRILCKGDDDNQFPFPGPSRADLPFPVEGSVREGCRGHHWKAHPQKHGFCRWNYVSMWSRTRDICVERTNQCWANTA